MVIPPSDTCCSSAPQNLIGEGSKFSCSQVLFISRKFILVLEYFYRPGGFFAIYLSLTLVFQIDGPSLSA